MPSVFTKKNDDVLCPFFHGDSAREIKCKDYGHTGHGLAGDSTVTCFTLTEDKKQYSDDFCCGCYQGCEVYIAFESVLAYRDR